MLKTNSFYGHFEPAFTYLKWKNLIICGRNLTILAKVFTGPPLAQKKAAADDITVRLRLFYWNGEGQRAFCVYPLAKVDTE